MLESSWNLFERIATYVHMDANCFRRRLGEARPTYFALVCACCCGEGLQNGLSEAVKAILIERNYIDKDYRSTFYNFYVKKGRRYRPDCVRFHFFDQVYRLTRKRFD